MLSSYMIELLFLGFERLHFFDDFLSWRFLDDFLCRRFLHCSFSYDFSYRFSGLFAEVFGIVECEDRYEYDLDESDSESVRPMFSESFCDLEEVDDHQYGKYRRYQDP